MKERLIIIRKKDLTVAQLDELKDDDNVPELRSVLEFLLLVVRPGFKTSLPLIDVRDIFEMVTANKITLKTELTDAQREAFLKEAQSAPTQNVTFINPDDHKKR